jgi:NADPH:quinone reductase-like Zn-dependent oxidoreductase
MKAIAYDRYGSFDVLAFRDIDKSSVKGGEVLVRVRAAGLRSATSSGVRGAPLY